MFSQIKDIKHIQRDFYSVAWFMPQGVDLGMLGSKIKFFEYGHVAYQIEGNDELNKIQVQILLYDQTGDLG